MVKGDQYVPMKINDQVPDPVLLVEDLLDIYGKLLVLDLDGINRGRPQYDLAKDMSSRGSIWMDAGTENADGIIDQVVSGVERIVVGTKTLTSWDELEDAVDITENAVLSVDFDGNIISPDERIRKKSPATVASMALSLGISNVILADMRRVGTQRGLDRELISSVAGTGVNLYVGGGVMKVDVSVLEELGAAGAIIEMSEVLKR